MEAIESIFLIGLIGNGILVTLATGYSYLIDLNSK
jgi:hypothetical protein